MNLQDKLELYARKGYAILEESDYETMREILSCAQAVINNWEAGDLAGSVRELKAAIETATGDN